ncbi:MAG: HAMP domain-containing protein [Chloroflexota bacterium]
MTDETISGTKKSLQRQMTITLSVATVTLILLVALPMGFVSVRLQNEQTRRTHQDQVDKVARDMTQILQELQTNQLQISLDEPQDIGRELQNPENNYVVPQILRVRNLVIVRVTAQTQEIVQENQALSDLFDLNSQVLGVQHFTLTKDRLQSHWRDESIVSEAGLPSDDTIELVRQGTSTQDDLFFSQDHMPVMAVAVPLPNKDVVESLAIVWVGFPVLWAYLTDLPVGQTGYVYIVDEAQRLIQRPSRFADVSPRASATLRQETVVWRTDQLPYIGLNDGFVLGKMAPIEDSPWTIVAEVPISESNASLRSLLIILISILLFGVSVAIWVARLFSRWILQPISTLHESATEISAGNLAHRINLERDDELGFLAETFNSMVSRLEKTITELRAVSLNLLTAQESERQRIAQQLHDELGQSLTALRFGLSMGRKTEVNQEIIETAYEQATLIQQQARSLSHELRPAMLDELGLFPTLEWFIDRIEQRANLAISLTVECREEDLSSILKTAIYRLVVESLTNIDRHAQASGAEISLIQTETDLGLTVQDDGIGLDLNQIDSTATLGLSGMRERVNLLGGQFLIESKIEQGVKIDITLPLVAYKREE